LFWTDEQLLKRLRLATKASLDIYKAVVDRHMPSIAPELDTYRLLPARIVGHLTPAEPQDPNGIPSFAWFIEPLDEWSDNDAIWTVGDRENRFGCENWEPRLAHLKALRGDSAEHIDLLMHYGEPEIYASTPAGSLALKLLADDLAKYKWCGRAHSAGRAEPSVPPRFI
jgi:hypothetical protein